MWNHGGPTRGGGQQKTILGRWAESRVTPRWPPPMAGPSPGGTPHRTSGLRAEDAEVERRGPGLRGEQGSSGLPQSPLESRQSGTAHVCQGGTRRGTEPQKGTHRAVLGPPAWERLLFQQLEGKVETTLKHVTFLSFSLFCHFKTAPTAYGNSQARG